MASSKHTVRVAAVQAEACYFDLQAAVSKTCKLIEDAAAQGCDLIAFPEVWIPNYPGWIWSASHTSCHCTAVSLTLIPQATSH